MIGNIQDMADLVTLYMKKNNATLEQIAQRLDTQDKINKQIFEVLSNLSRQGQNWNKFLDDEMIELLELVHPNDSSTSSKIEGEDDE